MIGCYHSNTLSSPWTRVGVSPCVWEGLRTMSNIWQGRTNHALCGPIKGEFPQTENRMILDFPTIVATKFWLFILNYDFVKNIFTQRIFSILITRWVSIPLIIFRLQRSPRCKHRNTSCSLPGDHHACSNQ